MDALGIISLIQPAAMVRMRGGSSIVSGQIPANALLSVALRTAPGGD